NKNINNRFFYDERKSMGGLLLTDNFLKIAESASFDDLNQETDSRWRLVETAWSLGISKNVVQIAFDQETDLLHTQNSNMKRVDITSSRSALNGYQKGKCFYCFRKISLKKYSFEIAEVDHFFPHRL
ncbi:MAG TPA: HNH endonuclease, partial [Candidatus Atribacteria bacterium]|nr:HNH endonuclease [Candidatus Atribacteria bacterium]